MPDQLPEWNYAEMHLCRCGCGQQTSLASKTTKRRGYLKGEYQQWLPGHHAKHMARDAAGRAIQKEFRSLGWPHANPRLTFWANVRRMSSGCWEWQRTIVNGYGRHKWQGRNGTLAHRIAYSLMKGPIPDDLPLDHLCRNTRCVNPDHLEAVTVQENNRRSESIFAKNRRKTHCKRGHEFTVENTYVYPAWHQHAGNRRCRACRALGMRTPQARLSSRTYRGINKDRLNAGDRLRYRKDKESKGGDHA